MHGEPNAAVRAARLRTSAPTRLGPTAANRGAALRLAAKAVSDEWSATLSESFDPQETASVVQWLEDAVEKCSRDAEVPVAEGPVALTRFLLERLNTALLGIVAESPDMDKADVLVLMHGVDVLRNALAPDWDRYFNSQISGPDGLNLMLEVAHDFRSPLTSIRCLAEALERGQSGPVTDQQRRQLRLIYSAALGLDSMSTDVIEMARRGDQLVDSTPSPFSVSELLEGVASLVRPIAEEKGLAFEYGSLPSDQRIGPAVALHRVLLNLVTNAMKFTEEGRVDIRLRAVAPGRVEFSVVDTGRGIPDAAIPELYRPFRRSSGRGRSGYLFSGTGLGLALCRKMLRALGSDLHFETEVGTGTRFFFELDLAPVAPLWHNRGDTSLRTSNNANDLNSSNPAL